MTTDDFTDAASAAAEKQWPRELISGHPLSGPERMNRRIGFTMGAEWARTHLATQEPTDAGQVSDGYHTFDELYEYRMLYNAHAATAWAFAGFPVVKSWRHSDGDECFGGGWFIVTAELPTGQVSNHYAAEHWDLFQVPEVDLPPAWDGHTPQDAANRLRACLAAARTARRDEEKRDD